ncbi:MAG: glucosaminidase domain-containing protein [Spirochaetaceae bacterium]|jgi:hypothetical protein|nr:glucosaminidase domain-containing protein [Spirochaetaceae bacterium]
MKKNVSVFITCVFIVIPCISSCASIQAVLYPDKGKRIPPVPEEILGTGRTNHKALARFLCAENPLVDADFAENFAKLYIEEAKIEGVNHDVAFAQMCLETGFLRYGGLVTPDMNNFCGLGSIGPASPGEKFTSPRIGVRAQIQHLKSYAVDAPLKQELVDPRRRYVKQGSSPTIDGLAGTWAADKEYGKKLKKILARLYENSFAPSPIVS